MALTWTLADVRYRFRVRCARIPIRLITFGVVAGVGTLSLLTDLWYAEHWLVPRGSLVSPSEWEAFLAALFLLAIVTWAWLAFMNPPRYSKTNAENYASTLYRSILQGSLQELPVIADELIWSAQSLVRSASDQGQLRRQKLTGEQVKPPRDVEAIANDLLLLIGDRRFCRTVVQSSPATALAIFESMLETKKFGVPVETFASNIVSIAIENKDSFIYTEAEGFNSGLLGYHKPLTQALFSNYELVATVGRMFEPDWRERRKWDADQWEAFYRAVLMTLEDYVKNHSHEHSAVLYSAMKHSEEAVYDLHRLNGQGDGAWEHDVLSRLRVIVEFIEDVLDILDKNADKIALPAFTVRVFCFRDGASLHSGPGFFVFHRPSRR